MNGGFDLHTLNESMIPGFVSSLNDFLGKVGTYRIFPANAQALPKNLLAVVLVVLAAVAVAYILTRQVRWWKEFIGEMTSFFAGESTNSSRQEPPSEGNDSERVSPESAKNDLERDQYD